MTSANTYTVAYARHGLAFRATEGKSVVPQIIIVQVGFYVRPYLESKKLETAVLIYTVCVDYKVWVQLESIFIDLIQRYHHRKHSTYLRPIRRYSWLQFRKQRDHCARIKKEDDMTPQLASTRNCALQHKRWIQTEKNGEPVSTTRTTRSKTQNQVAQQVLYLFGYKTTRFCRGRRSHEIRLKLRSCSKIIKSWSDSFQIWESWLPVQNRKPSMQQKMTSCLNPFILFVKTTLAPDQDCGVQTQSSGSCSRHLKSWLQLQHPNVFGSGMVWSMENW